jgi:hypothetical protein
VRRESPFGSCRNISHCVISPVLFVSTKNPLNGERVSPEEIVRFPSVKLKLVGEL